MIQIEDLSTVSSSREHTYNTFCSQTSKFNGLVELSPYKKVRNLLFELMRYIYSSTTSSSYAIQMAFKYINILMMWIRFFQLFGPSLYINYVNSGKDGFSLWNHDEPIARIIEYLSVLWNLVPPLNRFDACPYILLIYSILFISFFILIVCSARYYKKFAKLPKFISPIIVIFINTFGFVFHQVATAHGFEAIGHYINFSEKSNLAFNIITFFIFLICLIVYFILCIQIFAISIEFRDSSMLCILYLPQIQVMISSTVLTAIGSFFTTFSHTVKAVGCFLNAAIYVFLFVNRYIEGGFIKINANIIFATVTFSGACISALCGVLTILETKMNTTFILIIIAFMIIVAIVMTILEKINRNRCLLTLDDYSVTGDLSVVKTVRSFMLIIIAGFERAHPICTNYKVFNDAVQMWTDETKVWCAFLKFLAIYTELTSDSMLVVQKIQTNKLKGYMVKNFLYQTSALLKSRDVNLSPELKKKISDLSKKVQIAKHKMRNIWDMVIQGNINEMDRAVENCFKTVENTTTEFEHVASQYSNNRFIARAYTRFCHEVLANKQLANEWYEKSRMLQKGIRVTTDAAHDLGLEAFPLLASTITQGQTLATTSEFDMSTSEGFNSELDDEAKNQQTTNQNIFLINAIEKIRIPSIRHSIVSRLVLIFILFFIPLIAFCIYMPILINTLVSPLDFIFTLSYLRCIGFQVAIIGHHYVLEAIPEHLVDHAERSDRNPPESLGSSFDPRVQLLFLLKTGSSMIQSLSKYASFMEGNPSMDRAREVIFGRNMDYIFFKSRGDRSNIKVALQVGMMDVFNQLYSLLELNPITDGANDVVNPLNSSVLNTSKILNSVQNAETFGNYIYDSLDQVIQYLQDEDKTIRTVFLYLMIILIVVFVLLQVLVTVFCLREIRKNKFAIYRSLTSLPKNVVSSIVEYLRILKSDKEDTLLKGTTTNSEVDGDLNKQEENILKILMTGDSSGGVKSELLIIILVVLQSILFIVFVVYGCISIMDQSKNLVDEAPHIDYLLGAYTYDAATVLATDLMLGEFYDLSTDFKIPVLIERFHTRLERSQNYYSRLLYGDTSTEIKINPFKSFARGLTESINKMACNDVSRKPPATIYDGYKCIRPDVMLYIHHNMVLSIVIPVEKNNAKISKDNKMLPEIYDLSLMLLFENFFFPMFTKVVDSLDTEFHEAIVPIIIVSVVLFLISLIIEMIIIIINLNTKNHMIFALKLLLQCPPAALNSCTSVQKILFGDFTMSTFEGSSRNKEFFDTLVHNLPKACIICDQQGIIQMANITAARMFKSTDEELKGESVKTLLGDSAPNEFRRFNSMTKPVEREVLYTDKSGESVNLTIEMRPEQSMIILTFTDITLTVRYNTLIREEKEKSDSLLKSILPASLVPRVQKGEKDISFAVQTASVMFTDIVEFTPWCSSNSGPFVMSTLNTLFKEFDSQMAKYSTMTKIKCIGDCYMAAGGIFADVNQPAVHAAEAVDFGLDQINSVLKCNGILGTSLRVRVGVNTGGPIVAGVLGIGKPTFEILGPAINMAQQMEHHGVPMNVHISRSVYELIYGGKFKVKERGNIEIKNGTVQTYVVSNDF